MSGGAAGWRKWVSGAATLLLALAVVLVLAIGVGPQFLPYKVVAVLSGSMSPTIPVGSEMLLVQVPADQLKIRDIITFTPPGRTELVTHRIVAINHDDQGHRAFITRGDANPAPDPWSVPATGDGYRYVGSVAGAGFVLDGMRSGPGRLVLVGIPALLLVLTYAYEAWARRRGTARAAVGA